MSGNVLSAGQAAMVLFGVFVGLLIIRVPVAFALGLACVPLLLIEPHLSIMTLPGMRERAVRIGSAGKSFSLTGWKVGYVTAARELMKVIAGEMR